MCSARFYHNKSETKLFETALVISTGGSFGHYAYMTDVFEGRLFRMSAQGNTEFFTNTPEGNTIDLGEASFGEYLYLGTLDGEIYAYDANGNEALFATGFENQIIGIDIHEDDMWVTVGDTTPGGDSLYRITPVPEPTMISMIALGGMLAYRKRLYRK